MSTRRLIEKLTAGLIEQSEALGFVRSESVYRPINYVLFHKTETWIVAVVEPGGRASAAERAHLKRLVASGARNGAIWRWRDTGKRPRYDLEIEEL